MRLFVDAHVFDDLNQGSKTYLKGLYSSVLRMQSQDEFFFASNEISSTRRELNQSGNFHPLQYRSSNKFIRLGSDISRLIKENQIDWAHFQYISPLVKTCNEVVTIHDLLFLDYPEYFPLKYRLINGYLFGRSAKRAEWILTVSEFSKAAIVKHYNIRPEKIIITPNGILDLFWEPDKAISDFASRDFNDFVLYVSRIEPRKNHIGLLKSYALLELWKRGIKLIFVGGLGIPSPEFYAYLKTLPERVKKSVIFLENVELSDLKWLYQNCRLFVYPSFAEGFGIPPLEALACGANVICSGTTAMSEFGFLKDRLFDPNDQQDLTDKIQYYLDDIIPRDQEATRRWIRINYSWELASERFMNLFH